MCRICHFIFPKCHCLYFLVLSFLFVNVCFAEDSASPMREYPLSIGDPLDSRNVVRAAVALNKLGYDLYTSGISPLLPEWADPWIEPVWSFLWTFNLTMWPHDFGHWARANQAGGNFVIESYAFPFPLARMVVPDGTSKAQETLMSGGGFEINTLMRKYTEDRYYQTGYSDAEDIVHSFIQSMMFPLYTNVIAPTNANDPDSWGETSRGDPTQYTQLVFENYTGRPAVTADNKVDPDLVSLYREIFWMNILTIAIDPWMYKAAKAFTLDMKQRPQMRSPWLYTSDNFAWAYTSRFNTGVLGYEVYLTQHLKLNERYFSVYLRTGRPFKNNGIGVRVPDLVRVNRFSLDTTLDAWDQGVYGMGGMMGVSPSYRVNRHLRLSLDLHWKSDGYVIGLPVDQGLGWLANGTVYW